MHWMLGSQLVELLRDVLETLGAFLEKEGYWRWVSRAMLSLSAFWMLWLSFSISSFLL